MRLRINRPVLDLGACGILAEEIVAFPVLGRPDWSRNKSTTAIWTDVTQNLVDTVGAERALVAADACFK